MFKIIIKILAVIIAIASPIYLSSAHFENFIELTIKIEDLNFKLKVSNVKFNGEEIPLDEPHPFKPRKVATFKLPPGRYTLTWTTERISFKLPNESPTTDHSRILVLEGGDTVVHVSIKGEAINLY